MDKFRNKFRNSSLPLVKNGREVSFLREFLRNFVALKTYKERYGLI